MEMLIYQSEANLDVKILFEKITHHFDPVIRKILAILARSLYGDENSTFESGQLFTRRWNLNSIQLSVS